MYLTDYHTHSKYSFDGCEEPEKMCEKAIARGLSELAVTDHMDIFRGLDYGHMKDFDVPQDEPPYEFGTAADPMFADRGSPGADGHFTVDIPGGKMRMPFGRPASVNVEEAYRTIRETAAKYRGRLKLRAGVELGQPMANPEAAAAFLRDWPLDFVIASIHDMDYDLDLYYYDFSTLDPYVVFDRYLDELIDLAQHADFDVLGHITYPLRYMYERNGIKLKLRSFTDKLRVLFSILEYSGRGIELNVSGLSKDMNDTMPPFGILKMYRDQHGEIITIGSDAHIAEHIGDFQPEARDMLAEAGFRYITLFENRKPEFVKLD